MENKINIAEILRNCPTGMELDCTMYDTIFFYEITSDPIFPILMRRIDGPLVSLTKYGEYANCPSAKCVIFPKGKTTWEGFVPPCKFNDGDVVVAEGESCQLFLLKHVKYREDNNGYDGYCYFGWDFLDNRLFEDGNWGFNRLATEEERQRLFQAIEEHGYKWNEETKTLEKLKFKVGDKIVHKIHKDDPFVITEITEQSYKGGTQYEILIEQQDNFELVPNKFDISSLVPFESRVLIRNSKDQYWVPAFWGYMAEDGYITTFGHSIYCIPFEGNAHLLKTKNDCDEYFKTWE